MTIGSSSWRPRRAFLVLAALATALTLCLGGCPDTSIIPDPASQALEGTWAGKVSYTVALFLGSGIGSSYTFTVPWTVTFNDKGLPDAVDLPIGDGEKVFRVPAASLRKAGDTGQTSFDTTNPTTQEVTTVTIDLAVATVTQDSSSLAMKFDVDISFSTPDVKNLIGTYELHAYIAPDETLSWTGLHQLRADNALVDLLVQVTSAGSLVRQ